MAPHILEPDFGRATTTGNLPECAEPSLALIVLSANCARHVWETLRDEHWSFAAVASLQDLQEHAPEETDCLVLDTSCQPLVTDILAWCEGSQQWRTIPKFLLIPPGSDQNTARYLPVDNLDTSLRSLRKVAAPQFSLPGSGTPPAAPQGPLPEGFKPVTGSTTGMLNVEFRVLGNEPLADRRRHFRCRCDEPLAYQQTGALMDLSVGGMALEISHPLSEGARLSVCVSAREPLLRAVSGEVVACRPSHDHRCCAHVLFRDLSPAAERALQRHLMSRQSRRISVSA